MVISDEQEFEEQELEILSDEQEFEILFDIYNKNRTENQKSFYTKKKAKTLYFSMKKNKILPSFEELKEIVTSWVDIHSYRNVYPFRNVHSFLFFLRGLKIKNKLKQQEILESFRILCEKYNFVNV